MNSEPVAVVRPAMPSNPDSQRIVMRHRKPGRARAAGFTLIEIIVAFAVLAIGLGIAMQIATGAMRNARHAEERTEAALYAQSLLDAAGIGERLEEGETSGEFADRYRWTLSVAPFEVEATTDSPLDPALSPVQLYRLELVVTWGRQPREQEARFVTLRALTPDPGV
jgi:general secretion pathway protein I